MMTHIRRETDIDVLIEWRRETLQSVFGVAASPSLLDANYRVLSAGVRQGHIAAVIAGCDGADAGCGMICYQTELPSPDNHSGLCGYLMNIYVRESCRCQGIGRKIVEALVADALSRGCGKIYLETTDEAEKMYRSAGFDDMQGMMKYHSIV